MKTFLPRLVSTCGLLAVGLAFAPVASAVPAYGEAADLTGTRTTGGGGGLEYVRDPGDGSLGTLTLEWNIQPLADDFLYSYTFSSTGFQSNASISHFTLDLTDDCVTPQTDPGCVFDFELNGQSSGGAKLGDFDGITGAVKFDTGGELDVTYEFKSERAPVWGDTFIKEGTWDAANIGFGDRDLEDPLLYIARPNGTTEVPAPAVLGLLGIGLLALFGASRRR